MNPELNLRGMGVALITPFSASGEVDYQSLENLLRRLTTSNVDYLVLMGTTGEPTSLSDDEQQAVIRFTVSTIHKLRADIPIVLGLGGNCTQALVRKIETSDLTGISALLSVVPYYVKPSQEGIYRHYERLAEASPLPLILYNVPSRTGVNMTPSTVLRLATQCPNIIALKEASGDMNHIKELFLHKPPHFQVISGDDALALDTIALGAVGVISVIGNAFPRLYGQMIRHALDGRLPQAAPIRRRLEPALNFLADSGNPVGIKTILSHTIGCLSEVRLPLVPLYALALTEPQFMTDMMALGREDAHFL
jgi:4-hydroxy-tetrahydrodipicolinate synthase